jgi:hypothetical protein
MSDLRQKISAQLKLLNIPPDACFTTVPDLLKLIEAVFSVDLSAGVNNDFVVIGHQTPGADDKNKLWIRKQRNGSFQGFYLFINKTWQRIFNRRNDEVIWLHGDSREIPVGFQLINTTTAGIDADVVSSIMSQYVRDTSITGLNPVYKYFAVRYIGI